MATQPGGTAILPLSLGIIDGLWGQVTMSPTGIPRGATATFRPAIISVDGIHLATTTPSIMTTAAQGRSLPAQSSHPGMGSRSELRFVVADLAGHRWPAQDGAGQPRTVLLAVIAALSLGTVTGISSCCNGGSFGAAPTNYSFQ
jgi:hypothetical protein